MVFIEGSYSRGYNSDNYFFRLINVRLLETIGAALTKSITLEIPIQNLNTKITDGLSALISEKNGKHTMKLLVIDDEQKADVEFTVQEGKVNIDSEFIDQIERIGLRYKIN